MRVLLLFCVAATLSLVSCKDQATNAEPPATDTAMETKQEPYKSFGESITDASVISQNEMAEKFAAMKPGDTVAVKFKAKVNSVCQNKGCWMRLDTGSEETLVKFKDYGFFMPKDIAGDEVIVNGLAFVDEMSVEDQRHFAEDAGKSEEEIAAITAPKRTLSVISDGVLLVVDEE